MCKCVNVLYVSQIPGVKFILMLFLFPLPSIQNGEKVPLVWLKSMMWSSQNDDVWEWEGNWNSNKQELKLNGAKQESLTPDLFSPPVLFFLSNSQRWTLKIVSVSRGTNTSFSTYLKARKEKLNLRRIHSIVWKYLPEKLLSPLTNNAWNFFLGPAL